VAELERGPALSDVRGLAGGAELAADVGGVQGGAGAGGEDEILLAVLYPGCAAVGGLLLLVGAERVGGELGQGQGAARFLGFGVAVGSYRAPDGGAGRDGRVGVRVAEVDVFPAQGAGFFGADAGCGGLMEEAEAGPIRDRLLSAFPAGTFARVDVLVYGDDPAVEPGGVAVRAFVDRVGGTEENWDSRETLAAFADTHSARVAKLHDGLLGSTAWVEFVPDTRHRRASPYDHTQGGTRYLGSQRCYGGRDHVLL
jgi:hypothetical protein